MTYTLTADEKIAFARDGVVCLRGIIEPSLIEAMKDSVASQIEKSGTSISAYDFEAIARQVWDERDQIERGAATRLDLDRMQASIMADPEARPIMEATGNNEAKFFYESGGWRTEQGIRETALHSQMPPVIGDLLDTDYLHFWDDTTFVKTPGTRQKTVFHQDLTYFHLKGRKCVIAWVPLDAADLTNGTLEYVRGSHLWGQEYAPNMFISQTPIASSPLPKLPDIEGNREDYDIIHFDVQPGDILIHDALTVHGAGGNQSAYTRRAISYRYCGDDMRFHQRPGALDQAYISHNLQEGDRLHCDDYPLVWQRPTTLRQLTKREAELV